MANGWNEAGAMRVRPRVSHGSGIFPTVYVFGRRRTFRPPPIGKFLRTSATSALASPSASLITPQRQLADVVAATLTA